MTSLRLIFRKTASHIPQLAALVLLLTVGVCFFITLFSIALRYETTADQYFADYSYADATLYGDFNDESIELLSTQKGVEHSAGRVVQDYREGDKVYRALSLTKGINEPYLYEGRLPKAASECLLLQRNAKAMGLSLGDTITLGGQELSITGLCASPEYVYLVQNERATMAEAGSFGVIFVAKDFFSTRYNEMVALTEDDFSLDDASKTVGAFQAVTQNEQTNYLLYRADLNQLSSFAYIFPFIFAVLIAVIIYIMLSRTIQKDRKQIGTMKALGMPDGRIIRIYLFQFGIAALFGGLLGCLLAMFVSNGIIGIFSSMFEVPTLSFVVYPSLWAVALLASLGICTLSGLMSLTSILALLPAEALRPKLNKGGGLSAPEHVGFTLKGFSFNTRYALKNVLRNKSRFFAVVLGMCGSGALLVFSLGFSNSIAHTQNEYFENFANYDLIVSHNPSPLDFPGPTSDLSESEYKALVMPAKIKGENYSLSVVEEGFDMLKIPVSQLENGVIIPEYFAEIWSVRVGDSLEINDYSVKVSAITAQSLGLSLYTSYSYLETVVSDFPPVYNTLYIRSNTTDELTSFLKDNNITYSTIADDRSSFESIMESMTVLIWFMIACSITLGFTVLYSVALINLSARKYEYMFMGVLGYRHASIMAAHIKETLLQLALAIPLGFVLGKVLLESIRAEFSDTNFAIAPAIFPKSYLVAALCVIGVTAIMVLITSRHINRLDIVEGLKEQDE